MNQIQESFFGMALKVKNFKNKNEAIVLSMPAILPLFDEFNVLLAQLIKADGGSRAITSGYTINKNVKRKDLETIAQKVSNALVALAAITEEKDLKKKMTYAPSKWKSCSEEELVTQALIVSKMANAHQAALVNFGVTIEDISTLDDATSNFITVIDDPFLAIAQRKEDNKAVITTIAQIRKLLTTKIDVLMRSFKVDNPHFHNLYLSARAITSVAKTKKPTKKAEIAAEFTLTVHKLLAYNPSTFYTIENKAKVPIKFSLSTTLNEMDSDAILIKPGDKCSRMAENLSASGRYLTVENNTAAVAQVWVWVE